MKHDPTKQTFDMMLGKYCGPALAGIKPSNMICIKKHKLPLFNTILQTYNNSMNKHDIYFSIINETETSYLLLVYRKNKMNEYLSRSESREILLSEGYPHTGDVNTLIDHLKERFEKKGSPPDEIGLFLGYPVGDVIGFKTHKGKNYLVSKYWKVYSNAKDTEKLFDRYDKCKMALCQRISKGFSVMDMFTKKIA